MHIDYYPGCTIKASAGQYETSVRAVLATLGIQMKEMEQWNCCGVVHSLASDNLIRHIAPIRVFARLQEQGGSEMLTLCDMCYNTLSQANHLVRQNARQRESINDFIEAEEDYDGEIHVLHLLQILRDRVGYQTIKKHVRRALQGLTVFPYYGCKLLRPGGMGIDDPEAPRVLRDLMHTLGAAVADDPLQTQCCGSYHIVNHDEIVSRRVGKIAARALERGADVIVLSCPLCHFNLDTRQALVDSPLPVLYFTQLMGVAFGLDLDVLGLNQHHIDPLMLLQQRGFVQEEEALV